MLTPDPFEGMTSSGSAGSATSSGLSGYPAVEPAPLDDVRQWLARYIRTTTEADLDLLTLWAVHTHLVTELYTTPDYSSTQ